MRIRERAVVAIALAGAIAGVAGLAGCVDGERLPSLPPAPSTAPVFESEEEALAAAEAAYAAFVEALDAIGMDGWRDSSRLKDVATEPALSSETETVRQLESLGYRQVGASTFDSVSIQQYEPTGDVRTYLCLDLSNVIVVDATGAQVTRPDREPRVPLEVGLRIVDGVLLVSEVEPWSGSSFC